MGETGVQRQDREDGAAAVEFAIVVLPLLVIVFGLIQFGVFFFEYQGAAAAAREGARQAAVGQPCAIIQSTVEGQSPGGADTDVATSFVAVSPNVQANAPSVGDNVIVTTSFPASDFGLPLVPIPSATITQQAAARIEVVNPAWPASGCTE